MGELRGRIEGVRDSINLVNDKLSEIKKEMDSLIFADFYDECYILKIRLRYETLLEVKIGLENYINTLKCDKDTEDAKLALRYYMNKINMYDNPYSRTCDK